MYLRVSPYLDLLEGMSVALQINEGIAKLSGHDGVGKSATCRELAGLLSAHGQQVLYMAEAPASVDALYQAIGDFLGLEQHGNFTKRLTTHLLAQPAERRLLYLIVDDAEHMDEQTFDGIRMLCNIQDNSRALVKPVICGSEALEKKLAHINLRSLAQYLSQSFSLSPMTDEQLKDFYWAYWKERGLEVQPPNQSVIANLSKASQGLPGPALSRLDLAYQRVIDRREGRQTDDRSPLQQRPAKPASSKLWPALGLGAVLSGAAATLYWWDLVPPLVSLVDPPVSAELPPEVSSPSALAVESNTGATTMDSQMTVEASEITASLPDADGATIEPSSQAERVSLADEEIPMAEAGLVAEALPALEDEPAVAVEEVSAMQDAPALESLNAADTVADSEDEDALEALLVGWTGAWQAKDMDTYFSYYSASFQPPNGDSRDIWQQQRRNSIGRAADILISWDSLELQAEDETGITVQFWLHYSASNYGDDTLKELVLLKTNEGLRIDNERNLLVERPQ